MSEFLGVVTLAGQALIAGAIGGTALTISHVAVGDGNGAAITPNEAMTALVHEVWRGSVAAGGRDPVNANVWRFSAEILEADGPFDIREIAAFASDGTMVAIAKHPFVEKRTPAGGAGVSITTDIIFPVSDTAQVTLTVQAPTAVGIQKLMRAPFIAVESATVTAPPGGPAIGVTYLVPAGATGAWAGQTGKLAQWDGYVWELVTPAERTLVGVKGGDFLMRTAAGWTPAPIGVRYALAAGSANTVTATLDPAPTALAAGLMALVKIANTNTGAATLNLNGLGAKAIKHSDGTAMAAGELVAGQLQLLAYEATADEWRQVPSVTTTAVTQAVGDSTTKIATTAFVQAAFRERLLGARTYYVRTDGSDANNGLANTAGGAFLTVQKALDVAAGLDFNGNTVTVSIGDGTYTAETDPRDWVGGGRLKVKSTTGTPGNQILTVANGHPFNISTPLLSGILELDDVELRVTSTGNCINAASACDILIGPNLRFGPCAGDHIHLAAPGARVTAAPNYSAVAAAVNHIAVLSSGAEFVMDSGTVTLVGTPAFANAFVQVFSGRAKITNNTFTGSATGKRYDVQQNGTLLINGATLPGSIAGTTATSGQVI